MLHMPNDQSQPPSRMNSGYFCDSESHRIADDYGVIEQQKRRKEETYTHSLAQRSCVNMMAADLLTYEIKQLRLSEYDSRVDAEAVIGSYRAFRLSSLQSDPDAFASTYLEESKETDQFWQTRLANPKAIHFVAVRPGCDRTSSSNWLGMVVLLGPKEEIGTDSIHVNANPWSSFSQSQGRGSDLPKGAEKGRDRRKIVSFHLNGTYTVPTTRRRGIGAALFKAALLHAEQMCRQIDGAELVCTLYVDADNGPAVKLYENRGFRKVEEHLYKPKPVEAGERPEKLAWKMVMRKSTFGV